MFDPVKIDEAYFEAETDGAGLWEKKNFEVLPSKLIDEGWSLADVICIYLWKRNDRSRSKTLKFALGVDDEIIDIVKSAVLNNEDVDSVVDQLTTYDEMGPATASALLTFADPTRFTPYDENVRAALEDIGRADTHDLTVGEVTNLVRDLADEFDQALRTIDRGLYLHTRMDSDFTL